MHIFIYLVALAVVLFGCSSDKTIPLDNSANQSSVDGPNLPTGGLIATPDAIVAVIPDMTVDAGASDAMPDATVDAGQQDAEIMTNQVDAGPTDEVQAEPEYVFDVEPSVIPAPGSYTIVGGGDFSQLVYWRGGRIIRQAIETQISAPEMNMVPNLGALDPQRVSVSLGEPQRLGYRAPAAGGVMDGRLDGVVPTTASQGHRGWVIVSNGSDGRTTVFDLNQVGQAAFDLGLFGPLRTTGYAVSTDVVDQVLVMGRVGPEEDAAVAYAVLAEGISPEPVLGMRGYPLPVSVTTAGVHWMMAFEDGVCVILEALDDGPGEEIGMWRCHTDAKSKIVGRAALGDEPPAIYGLTQASGRVVAWDIRPGFNITPINADIADESPVGGSASGGADGGGGSSGADLSGMPALGGAEENDVAGEPAGGAVGEAPAQEMNSDATPGTVSLSTGAGQIRWLNPMPNGYALAITEGDVTRYVLVDGDGIGAVELTSPEHVLGIIKVTGGVAYALRWDTDKGEPILERATITPTNQPPAAEDAMCDGQVRAPERCDGIDHDCDGRPYGTLCCARENTVYRAPRPVADVVTGDWSVFSDPLDGVVGVFPFDDRVEIRTLVSSGASLCLGCFADIVSIKTAVKRSGLYAILAQAEFQNDQVSTCPQVCTSITPEPVNAPAGGFANVDGSENSGGTSGDSGGLVAGQAADSSMAGSDGAGGVVADQAGIAAGEAVEGDENIAGDAPLRDLLLLRFSSGALASLTAPCRNVLALELTRNDSESTLHLLCSEGRYEYVITAQDDGGGTRYVVDERQDIIPYDIADLRWVGPPTRRFEDSDVVTHRLAAFGEDYTLVLLQMNRMGLTALPLPDHATVIANGPIEGRMHPIRLPISPLGYIARSLDERVLEVFNDGRWVRATARRDVQRLMFAHWDDLAVSLAPLLDATADDFELIYQELVLFTHQLVKPALHWGHQISETIAKFKAIEFQGMTLGDYANPVLDVSQPPLLWWAVGSQGFAPTARTTSLTCYE